MVVTIAKVYNLTAMVEVNEIKQKDLDILQNKLSNGINNKK